jgi:AcrR family transcriptional regulator
MFIIIFLCEKRNEEKERENMLKAPDDRRAVRTRRMIRNALSELIEEKGYNNISITDLTARADINRGTFYLHYTDKYDLLEQVENEVIQEIYDEVKSAGSLDVNSMEFINNLNSADMPMPFMIKIFEYLMENSKFVKAILGPKGDPKFHIKLKNLIESNLFENNPVSIYKKDAMLIPTEYFISYVLSAHLGVIQQWLHSGMDKSPDEMTLILSKMFLLGPFKVSGIK